MLACRQDISVLLLYFAGYSLIRNLFLRIQRKPVARFVTIHDILPEAKECFKANMNFLKRSTNVVSLDDYISGKLSTKIINSVITFDDGYKSWVSAALPILKELELPATFFVSSGFVGLSREEESTFIRTKLFSRYDKSHKITGSLNLEDLKIIAREGFTIGGHTLNHTNLAILRDSEKLRYEIAEDKNKLEKLTRSKIDYFAYPSGAIENPETNITELLKELGYKAAVTTASGFNIVGSNPYHLYRELTGASMPGLVFRARVYGNYDAVKYIKQIISKIILK